VNFKLEICSKCLVCSALAAGCILSLAFAGGKFMQHIFQHTQAAVKIKLHGCYKFGDGGRSWSQILLRLFKNSDCAREARPQLPFALTKYIFAIFEILLLTTSHRRSKFCDCTHGVRVVSSSRGLRFRTLRNSFLERDTPSWAEHKCYYLCSNR
jgi:hypothetical protein